jgi:starch phosphorylase
MFKIADLFPYPINPAYEKPVAYFSMEFAIDQSLKIYSGGLGFLAGSHMRSAYELHQNMVGIGILWKYGYYDQERNRDGSLRVNYIQKDYYFLEETDIKFTIEIHHHPVHVKVWFLKPEIFGTAPVFLLSTDMPENDFLAQTITHRLYDHHESARIAQSILLGYGGAKLLDILERKTEIYHLNEGHALPLCFYLLKKFNYDLQSVRKHIVFTTHTPEKAGNEEHDINMLEVMGFFQEAPVEIIHALAANDKTFNYTLAGLRLAGKANGVSKLHGQVASDMWKSFERIAPILSITNAQNKYFWMDEKLEMFFNQNDHEGLMARKKEMKKALFRIIADQCGRIFSENILTIVWARRFAAYKRADLILRDMERFKKIVQHADYPVQFIWAGKPYPEDQDSINRFNDIFYRTKEFSNCAVLTGYEIGLSGFLKRGSDVWLNNPRMYREASGTSGMTAAMNGSINLSIADGWVPEFASDGKNCFLIGHTQEQHDTEITDQRESENLYDVLEKKVIPLYYNHPKEWSEIMFQSMRDVILTFDSGRMAREYYNNLYN